MLSIYISLRVGVLKGARFFNSTCSLQVRTRLALRLEQQRAEIRDIARLKSASKRAERLKPSDEIPQENEQEADLRRIATDGSAPISVNDQEALLEQLIAVRDPVFSPVPIASLETHEYAPVSSDSRWLSLPGVRGVELVVPRRWRAWRGQGTCLSIPFRSYHFAIDGPGASAGGLTTVALTVTLYKGAFSSPILRTTQHSGALGLTQLFAQIHQVRRMWSDPPGEEDVVRSTR